MGSPGFSWKLPDHPNLPKGKQVAVVVLDGWGEANPNQYNCIHIAQTPAMDSLKQGAPDRWRLVRAHGTAVGLPSEDDMACHKISQKVFPKDNEAPPGSVDDMTKLSYLHELVTKVCQLQTSGEQKVRYKHESIEGKIR